MSPKPYSSQPSSAQSYDCKQLETATRHYPQCQNPLSFQVAASLAPQILTRKLQSYNIRAVVHVIEWQDQRDIKEAYYILY